MKRVRGQLSAQCLDHSQCIASEDFPNARFGPAAIEHLLDQARKGPNPRQVFRRDDESVVVRADRRVIFADGVDDMLEMVHERRDRDSSTAQIRRVHHDADGASGICHHAQLLVGDVPPVVVHAGQSRVRHEQRLRFVVYFDGVEEPRPTDVREIHANAQLVQPLDVRFAEVGEPRGTRRARGAG